MRRRDLSIILVISMLVSVLWVTGPLGTVEASAQTYKGGFSVTPTKYDDSGIALDTGFLLSARIPVTLDYLKQNLSIRDQASPEITQLTDGRFLIKPSEKLENGRLYIIDIRTPDGQTVSFAFQTPRDFSIAGSLPRNTSVNVPVNTGIEVYFTYPDVEDFEKFFEISPKVEGRFEEHGYARCFIPKKLEPGTVYTVTVKKGLRAANGTLSLNDDYTFSFETSPDSSMTADPNPGYLGITDIWFDFSTREKPVIPFYLYLPDTGNSQKNVDVKASVYSFPDEDALIAAIREREKVPYWASYTGSKVRTDVSSLEKVLEFTQSFNTGVWSSMYIMLPESLPHGFYIIELSCGNLSAQAFIQSSDVSAFFLEDNAGGLFWVNNIVTGRPSASALVYDPQTGKSAKTDRDGLARLSGTSDGKDPAKMDIYKIKTADGLISLLNTGYLYVPYDDEYDMDLNWRYLQTDRTLYKPDDSVKFWGFVKSRTDNTFPEKVTAEISEDVYLIPIYGELGSSIIPFFTEKSLVSVTLDVKDGFFSGEVKLPLLDPGLYNLVIRSGDKIVGSTYIQVENYVKPQYQLTVTSDKNAVFTGEKITFTVRASFFDGTPVSNIPVNYTIYGYNNSETGKGTTDRNGLMTVEYIPSYQEGMQGGNYFGFSASATLPETGEIHEYHSFRVFANRTELETEGEIRDGTATVSVAAHRVELETLNDDDPSNDRYLGEAIAGQKAEVKVYRVTWDKKETGEEYDYINKAVRKIYEYRERKTPVIQKTLVTGADGKTAFEFPVDKDLEGYYMAEITSQDEDGKPLKYQITLYDRTRSRYEPEKADYYYLKADRESYGSGTPVNIRFYRGDEPVTGFRALFVEARNGILSAEVKDQPVYAKPFDASLSPNYHVFGVMLTDTGYISSDCQVPYDYEEKRLSIDIKTDRESYRPGDACTVTVTAKDRYGRPVSAIVNVSAVDEALLSLSDQAINPLEQLYSWIGSGITRSSSTRANSPMYAGIAGYSKKTTIRFDEKYAIMDSAQSAAPQAAKSAGISEGISLRSDFSDTTLFETIRLDENGKGTLTFKLPDSVTSFRLAAAAISTDLQAGSGIVSAKVSMPFFISDSMSLTYLSGDTPYVGVTAYGQELGEDEDVVFELRCKELGDYVKTATAKAFERAYIPLPGLSEGTYNIEIYARSRGGLTDGIKRTVQVFRTYRTAETASCRDLVPGVRIDAGDGGLTTLIITDRGRGRLVSGLTSLALGYGHRLDQKLTTYQAQKLLNEILKPQEPLYEPAVPEVLSYRNDDGGYGILPYSSSDIRMSSLLAPWLSEVTDTASLKRYFYNALLTDDTVNASALYGLAALGEPVLTDLETARNTENLSLTDYILVGMAYEMLGETDTAMEIYNTRIKGSLEYMDPYIRVRVKNGDTDTSLEQTALLAAFTAGLGMEESDKMYAYVVNSSSNNVYTGAEQLIYLTERLRSVTDSAVEFDYTYDGRSRHVRLDAGQCEIIRIPSAKAADFKVTAVSGSASVVSVYEAPLAHNAGNDSNVTITRKYFNALTGEETTTFTPNDIVKVQIDYDIGGAAIDNTYEITDYAPSGLKPISTPSSYGITDNMGWYYRNIDGQKVTFVVGRRDKDTDEYRPLVYYARVAAPGEYTAEGTVAQGSVVKSSITVNGSQLVKILP